MPGGFFVHGTLTAILTAVAFWFSKESLFFMGSVSVIAGLYMAVQEALESVVTADLVSSENLCTSFGALGTVNGTAKFVSSSLVGVVWTAVSPAFGFGLAALLMTVGALAMGRVKQAWWKRYFHQRVLKLSLPARSKKISATCAAAPDGSIISNSYNISHIITIMNLTYSNHNDN